MLWRVTALPSSRVRQLAAWVGLAVGAALIWWAFWYPGWSGAEVYARAPRSASEDGVPPLHGRWEPKLFGPGTVPVVLIALLALRYAEPLAQRLSWRRLLLASYVVGLAWMFSLALVDGESGLSRQLGNPFEYLREAREVTDVGLLLTTWTDRMPFESEDAFVTHVAGHPPAALLFFVALVRVGLGGDLAAGVVVTLIAATTAVGVLVTLRALGAERLARRAAPFLVLAPSAIFMAVSFDAVIAATAAWGLALLALGATATTRGRGLLLSAVAGLVLGTLVMFSWGMPLMGLVALAVLASARSWLPLPVSAATALLVVLGFAVAGWTWWEVYPDLVSRYYEGIASERPVAYWRWANFALLLISAGPLLAAGLAHSLVLLRHRHEHRTALLLIGGAAGCLVAATISEMSKAEVERIWLPFMPWLLLSCALLPEGWRRWGLGLQLVTAVVVQQLLYTAW